MNINARTKVVALLGHPVEHSLSPAMQNAAFAEMGLNYCYVCLPVRPEMLGGAVEGLRALSFAGANVTVPHKEAVLPFLDEMDGEASFIGAVNTVVNREGRLTGYNTDGRGFMRSLEEEGIPVDGGKILVVGSGGAARAISYYLSEKAAEVSLFDVDYARAGKLALDLASRGRNVRAIRELDGLAEAAVVINATPLGLKESDPLPFDVRGLRTGQTVVDLIYRETRLLREAAKQGLRGLSGLGMLLWQGVLASELWTGRTPPHDVMRKALLKAMAG